MNYIKEINAFYDRVELVPLTASAVCLWHTLMHMNNKAKWAETFAASGTVLRLKSGLTESTFKRARAELKEKGYIDYYSRKHNQSPIYRMIRLSSVGVEEARQEWARNEESAGLAECDSGAGHRSGAGKADHTINRKTDRPPAQNAGYSADQSAGPLNKQNDTKQKETKHADAIVFYQENFGMVSPFIAESILMWVDDLGEELVLEAMKRAVERNKTSWHYVKSILQSWAKKGITTMEEVRAEERNFSRRKERHTYKTGPYPMQQPAVRKEVIPDWFTERKEEKPQENQPVPDLDIQAMIEDLDKFFESRKAKIG